MRPGRSYAQIVRGQMGRPGAQVGVRALVGLPRSRGMLLAHVRRMTTTRACGRPFGVGLFVTLLCACSGGGATGEAGALDSGHSQSHDGSTNDVGAGADAATTDGAGTSDSTTATDGTPPTGDATPPAADGSLPPMGDGSAFSDAPVVLIPGHTWYVRPDGGTRYSTNAPTGQCNGLADAAYPGTGTNQACAFGDVRDLWTDFSYNDGATFPGWGWVIAGGDVVIIRGGPWRVGASGPNSADWAGGIPGNPYAAGAPSVPSGTANLHTRILGENFGSCTTYTQLYGGYGTGTILSLGNSHYVDVACLELTDHSQCSRVGSPQYPSACSTGYPLDDYAETGIGTNASSGNILMQDIAIHGVTEAGIQGPIGGPINMSRVNVSFNAFAGWNFDDGSDTPDGPGSSINASYVTMMGNGCNEEYPVVDAFPAVSCYDLNDAGFGDSWSGQDTELDAFTCDHCVQAYNTKDGTIGPHTHITTLTITNSASYANMGEQWKWGSSNGPGTVTFENNFAGGNCNRMSTAMPGAPSNYNQYLSLFCRAAGDFFSIPATGGSTILYANNTVAGYSNTVFDMSCGGAASCTYIFRNNLFLGYLNPNQTGGTGEAPGLFYSGSSNVVVTSDHNLEFGVRNGDCGSSPGTNLCSDPLLMNEPSQTWTGEAQLDNFNFHLSSTSPAIGAGVPIPGLTTDYYGNPYANPPAIGAVQ